MELVMQKDLEKQIPQELSFNYEELKAELEARLEHYNSIVVTEDTIKEGKSERAALNSFKKAIDEYRKDVKKRYMAPYNEFEHKVKDLTSLIDQPIHAIDKQLDVFEQQRKEEKAQKVRESYEKIVPEDLRKILPYERIEDKKWLNATTTMKKVEEELEAVVKRTNADMLALNTVPDEYKAGVHAKYVETLDIELAMNHMHEQQKAEEAFKARKEEEQRRQEEQQKRQEEAQKRQEEQQKQLEEMARQEAAKREENIAASVEISFPDPKEKEYHLSLEFPRITMSQATELKQYLDEKGISYRKI